MTIITLDLLKAAFPTTKSSVLAPFVDPLNDTCDRFDISTINRKASFLAQVGHESGGFNFTKENLNYSAAALLKVFKKYFNATTAAQYARKPEKIANRVYANRMMNGPESSGDGWKYRGKGLIQVTGKENTTAFAKYMDMSLNDAVEFLETHEGAAISAGWFWDSRNLNMYADRGDITGMTRRINGGLHGIENRKQLFQKIKSMMS